MAPSKSFVKLKTLICVFFIGIFIPAVKAQSNTISGTVINGKTNEGVRYIYISVSGRDTTFETDSLGHFSYTVPENMKRKPVFFVINESPFAFSFTKVKAGNYPNDLKIVVKRGEYYEGRRNNSVDF